MTTFFMILAVGWIVFCILVLLGIFLCVVECRGKIKRGTIFVVLLLFIGISWGFDRVDEIERAMEREDTSISVSEN